jgi:hypothetical protein
MRKLAHIRMSELANGLVRGGVCALIVLFAQVANAQPEAIKVAADSAYIAGRYEDAIKGYEEISGARPYFPRSAFQSGQCAVQDQAHRSEHSALRAGIEARPAGRGHPLQPQIGRHDHQGQDRADARTVLRPLVERAASGHAHGQVGVELRCRIPAGAHRYRHIPFLNP